MLPGVPDSEEDPKVTRAKFFIRDEFLVKHTEEDDDDDVI